MWSFKKAFRGSQELIISARELLGLIALMCIVGVLSVGGFFLCRHFDFDPDYDDYNAHDFPPFKKWPTWRGRQIWPIWPILGLIIYVLGYHPFVRFFWRHDYAIRCIMCFAPLGFVLIAISYEQAMKSWAIIRRTVQRKSRHAESA